MLVIVALLIPLMLAIGAIVVDLGNFYEHRRHLQTRADAAALAGGGSWQFPCSQAVDDAIERSALQYSGPHNADTHRTEAAGYMPAPLTPVNEKVGTSPTNNFHITLNSSFWSSSSPPANYTNPPGSVCSSRVLDVKATETRTGGFFGTLQPDLTAKARVEVRDAINVENALPFAVESPAGTPCAWAIFVNERTNAVIGLPVAMTSPPTTGPKAGDPLTWEIPTPVNVNAPATNDGIGVRFRLGDCSDVQRRDVYSIDGTTNGANNSESGLGLVFAQTYAANWAANPNSPQQEASLGPVTLQPLPTCTDGNYVSKLTAPPPPLNASCTVNIVASVNFHGATGGVVEARMDDSGAWTALSPTGNGVFQGGNFSIGAKSARHQFVLRWARTGAGTGVCANNAPSCGTPTPCNASTPFTNNPCQWGPITVQKSFAAVVDKSGPIIDAKILSGQTQLNSIVAGGPVALGARITLADIQAAAPTDDPFVIRSSVQDSDNRSGTADCGGQNLYDDIISGCSGYQENVRVGRICSPAISPLDCIDFSPGNKRGPLNQGLSDRIDCNSTNYWRTTPNAIKQGDPRVVTIFITYYGALSRDSNDPKTKVPILAFASFYIVGWDGDNGCPQNDDYPLSGTDKNAFWGHFIRYTIAPSGGTPGPNLCDPNSLGTCVYTLVE